MIEFDEDGRQLPEAEVDDVDAFPHHTQTDHPTTNSYSCPGG